MESGDQVQERGLSTTRGADDREKLSGPHLEIDSLKRLQPPAVGRSVAERDVLERDFCRLARFDFAERQYDGAPARASDRTGWVSGHDRLWSSCHWIAFLPFSAITSFSNVKSYRRERSGICLPRNPASKADFAEASKELRRGS